MSCIISVSGLKTYVRVCVKEPVTAWLLEDFMRVAGQKARENGIGSFLIDLRAASNGADLFVYYQQIKRHTKEWGIRPGSKYALLVRQEDIDYYSFVSTFFINLGFQSAKFTNEEAASGWLES